MNDKIIKIVLSLVTNIKFKVKEIAHTFYGTTVAMKMLKQEVVFDTVVTSFEMKFENKVFMEAQAEVNKLKESAMKIPAAILFDMFPFCILFTVSGTFLLY